MMISIAIDGPSGAGKSSLSRKISEELEYIYVDTGALYRAIGLAALRSGKDTKSAEQMDVLLPKITLEMKYINGEQRVFLGVEDVSSAIRDEKVSMAASDVSAHPAVRAFLLETQRRMARENNVVMDGRDIGTVVLPNAQIKIFLTASVDDRAMRRTLQLKQAGRDADFEVVKKDVEQRDYNDSHRAAAPLKQAEDAILVDTTGLEIEQSFTLLMNIISPKIAQEKMENKFDIL